MTRPEVTLPPCATCGLPDEPDEQGRECLCIVRASGALLGGTHQQAVNEYDARQVTFEDHHSCLGGGCEECIDHGAQLERERIDSLLDVLIGIWQMGSSIHAETVFDVLCELRSTIEETAHV